MPSDTPMSADDHRAYGRMGGLTSVAKHGGEAMTLPMRRGRWASFERQVLEADPGLRERDPAELQTRAKALEDAHMEKMRAKLRAKLEATQEAAKAGVPICPECERAWGRKLSRSREWRLCPRHTRTERRKEAATLNKPGSPAAVTLRQDMAQLRKEWQAVGPAIARIDAFFEARDLLYEEVHELRVTVVRLQDRITALERERREKRGKR